MTDPLKPTPRKPTLRERARPAEVLGLSFVLAAFVGVGAFLSTRNGLIALVGFGAAFVVSVVVCAMLLLAISKPEPPQDGPSTH